MKLGMTWGYWGQRPPPDIAGVSQEAERLGFDSVWTAEAWGSDAFTPLAWIAAHTDDQASALRSCSWRPGRRRRPPCTP